MKGSRLCLMALMALGILIFGTATRPAFSADDSLLAVAVMHQRSADLHVLGIEAGDLRSSVDVVGVQGFQPTIAFTPDSGRLLLAASANRGLLSSWDWASGQLHHATETELFGLPAGKFSSDGKRFWTHYGKGIVRIDVETGKTTLSVQGKRSVHQIEISDDERLALVRGTGFAEVWDLGAEGAQELTDKSPQ